MRYAIELDTVQDVQDFFKIAQGVDSDVRLTGRDENGNPWELSAKSVLCVLFLSSHIRFRQAHTPRNVDWNTIYCECGKDIYPLIRS